MTEMNQIDIKVPAGIAPVENAAEDHAAATGAPAKTKVRPDLLPATYVEAKSKIAVCARIDECKSWADKAVALKSYAKQMKDRSLAAGYIISLGWGLVFGRRRTTAAASARRSVTQL
jgi:hypothetical protein